MSDCVRSKTWEENVPDVTPRGNPGNAGTVVATPAFVPSGAQQWMCAAVSGVVKPKNDAIICSVCAVGSSTTTAVPTPGETTGGTSFAPLRMVPNVIGVEWAAGTANISAVAMVRAAMGRNTRVFIWHPPQLGEVVPGSNETHFLCRLRPSTAAGSLRG